MAKRLVGFLTFLFPLLALAAEPICKTYHSGNYCQYSGKVAQIYVNSGNLVLLYFDVPISVSDANSYGMGISNGSAASLSITDNPDFANYFYSTALAAQASGRNVTMQMRGSQSGYLKVDRIWLAAP